jgi:hypothetical protein
MTSLSAKAQSATVKRLSLKSKSTTRYTIKDEEIGTRGGESGEGTGPIEAQI